MQNLIATSTCETLTASSSECVFQFNPFLVDSVSSILLSVSFIISLLIIILMLKLFYE